MSTHQIVVAGGGYAGIAAARKIARRVGAAQASVTLITDHETFDERPRWHQLATGQRVAALPTESLTGDGIRLRFGHISSFDPDARSVLLDDGRRVPYDALVIALGSTIDLAASPVPGAAEFARGVTSAEAASELARELDALPDAAPVTVVGGGLTGIELSTEVAESHPRVAVTLVSPEEPGAWLSRRARRHLTRAFERLGVRQVRGRVTRVADGNLEVARGTVGSERAEVMPSRVTIWAAGFRAAAAAGASGLAVDARGRVITDARFRSISHAGVWAVGDAAAISGPWGAALPMGARVAPYLAGPLAESVAAVLAGREPAPLRFAYQAECISLGRRDGVLQLFRGAQSAPGFALTGRAAARAKNLILRLASWLLRHPGLTLPSSGPTAHDPARSEMISA